MFLLHVATMVAVVGVVLLFAPQIFIALLTIFVVCTLLRELWIINKQNQNK